MNEKTEIGAEEKCENRILQEEPEVIVHELEYTKSLKLKEIMANDNEKLIPLFFPCYLVAIGTLTGISLIDPALLESANWKQNTIWSALLFFGLLPPYMRSTKGVWLIMGYILAFFLFGGGNVFGTVQLILSIFACIYSFSNGQTLGRSEEIWKMGVAVSGHCFDIYIVASVDRRPQYIPKYLDFID